MRVHNPFPRQGGPFGVCAAIGADFGFDPDILRVVLAAGLLWNLPAVVVAYGFAGLLMLAGRYLFPIAAVEPERPAVELAERIPPTTIDGLVQPSMTRELEAA